METDRRLNRAGSWCPVLWKEGRQPMADATNRWRGKSDPGLNREGFAFLW